MDGRNFTPSSAGSPVEGTSDAYSSSVWAIIIVTGIFHSAWIIALILFLRKISKKQSLLNWIELRFFKDPVIKLEKDRVENKYYPFITTYSKDNDPIFRLTYRPLAFYWSLYAFLASCFCFCFSVIHGWQVECSSVFGFMFWLSLVNTIRWHQVLQLDIEQDGENYYYYVGGKLRYRVGLCCWTFEVHFLAV